MAISTTHVSVATHATKKQLRKTEDSPEPPDDSELTPDFRGPYLRAFDIATSSDAISERVFAYEFCMTDCLKEILYLK